MKLSTKLAVALSCYDQLVERRKYATPLDALRAVAPMLASFVQVNWHESSHFVFGLSALGRPLDQKTPDEDFVDKGPASNGWIITPDGKELTDLTWPLIELLRACPRS
jgi:hypothetical protein